MLPAPFSSLPNSASTNFELHAGAYVFRLGGKPFGLFFLVDGEVHLIRHTKSGDAVPIHRAYAGEFFAEASLFSDAYHCDAIAQTHSKLLKIDRSQTLALMETNPRFSIEISTYLARQVQDYRRLLELRSIRSAQERVLSAVADGWLKGNILSFAAQLGLSHETVYRALSDLAKAKRLEKVARGKFRMIRR